MANMFAASLLGAAVLAAAGPALAAGMGADPLTAYRWKARVLVAVASDPADPKLAQQRALYAGMKAGARERDLVLVEAAGASPDAAALRKAFDLGPGFHAVLVGKDGGSKLTSSEPLKDAQLFPLIDAMPMRQDEMKRP